MGEGEGEPVMTVLCVIGIIIRFILRIILFPLQPVLTVLMFAIEFFWGFSRKFI